MCLAKAYVDREGKRELLMEEIASVEVDGEKLLLKTLFGDRQEVEANIKEINFMTHDVILEKETEKP